MSLLSKSSVVWIIAALCAVATVGCGAGGSTSDGGSTTGSASVEASREFVKKGGENKIPNFGKEADSAEREAASKVVEESLTARAAGDWAGQCATLSATAIKQIRETVPPAEGRTCAKAIETEAEPEEQTQALRANTMTEPIAALRVKGSKGYALYHGAKGLDYAMPMEKEGNQWKVSALITVTP
jgi:hypothetical protein